MLVQVRNAALLLKGGCKFGQNREEEEEGSLGISHILTFCLKCRHQQRASNSMNAFPDFKCPICPVYRSKVRTYIFIFTRIDDFPNTTI